MNDDVNKTTQSEEIPSMFKAAVWACALPMMLGGVGSAFSVVDMICSGGKFWGIHFLILPIFICFLLGTPITAWMSCRMLDISVFKKEDLDLSLGEVQKKAGVYSALVHFLAFSGYAVVLTLIDKTGDNLGLFILIMLSGGFINIILYICLTLPFSLICAGIFHVCYTLELDQQ